MPKCLLLVDDKPLARRTLLTILASSFDREMTYAEASDGLEAVEKAQAIRPDVVLIDLVMPRMNGLNAARQIAALCPEASIVMISMYDVTPFLKQIKDAGVRGFVPKSAMAAQLAPAVRAVLHGDTFFGRLQASA
jgi:two-component system, NarL family, nitrate/nitrite response regulator NarL